MARAKPSKHQRPPLLVKVWAEFGAAKMAEAYIIDTSKDPQFVHGHIEGGRITINTAYHAVETAVHEILHKLRTTFLMRRMTDDEIQELYSQYLSRRKCLKGPKRI
jgi:hypothetical protein